MTTQLNSVLLMLTLPMVSHALAQGCVGDSAVFSNMSAKVSIGAHECNTKKGHHQHVLPVPVYDSALQWLPS